MFATFDAYKLLINNYYYFNHLNFSCVSSATACPVLEVETTATLATNISKQLTFENLSIAFLSFPLKTSSIQICIQIFIVVSQLSQQNSLRN